MIDPLPEPVQRLKAMLPADWQVQAILEPLHWKEHEDGSGEMVRHYLVTVRAPGWAQKLAVWASTCPDQSEEAYEHIDRTTWRVLAEGVLLDLQRVGLLPTAERRN